MYIRSDRLMIWLDPPNQGWATTTRFDRTGAVTFVSLDGKYTFATPESHTYKKATTGGMGLMAEFLCPEFIKAATAGERFHKVGVGMVERGTEEELGAYSFLKLSAVPYDADGDLDGDDAAEFSSKSRMLHGYAFELKRRASVAGNQLTVEATLVNNGDKAFSLLEYNHNFVNLDDRPVGPDYRVDLTYGLTLDKPPSGAIRQNGNAYTFAEIPERAFFLTTDQIGDADTYGWRMTHAADSLSISERVSEKPARTAMWGTNHIVSVEVFVPVSLDPGQKKTWTRVWTFDA